MTLKEMRKRAGYTQEELGKIIGVDNTTVSLYELRLRLPDIITIVKIADVLEVTLDELASFFVGEQGASKTKSNRWRRASLRA